MKLQIRKRTQGFTIIEVLIVLAIAGLIMAIVFLAVPALRRNSSNTSRRSDASHLAGLVNEYASNHAGGLPTTALLQAACTGENFTAYTTGCTGVTVAAAAATNTAGTLTNPYVYTNATCDPNTGVVSVGGGTKSFAVQYEVQTSSGSDDTCIQG